MAFKIIDSKEILCVCLTYNICATEKCLIIKMLIFFKPDIIYPVH